MKNTRTFLLAFAATLLAGPAFPQTLSNPLADEGTKQRYHFLATYQDSPGQCLILGQNLGWSFEQFGPTVETLHDVTGQWPGLIGGQLRQAPDEIDLEALKLLYKNWQQAGGLVEMSMLPDNPWTGGSAWDISQTNIQQLTTPGQPGYTQWTAELDFYADVLSQMQDLGITVIWRPLVEMNGDWFWYGFHGSNDPQPYIDLYRNMYDYFTHTWHLNNLIWVYAANVSYSGIQSVGHFYPGSDVVDIVGLDIYENGLAIPLSQYQTLTNLNKPFAVTEFGPNHNNMDGSHDYNAYMDKILADFPKAIYALAWHDWPDHAVAWISNQNYQAALNKPCVLSRDDLAGLLSANGETTAPGNASFVFPNPAKDAATLTLPVGTKALHISIVNAVGIGFPLLWEQSDPKEYHLSWDRCPPGLYYLKVETDKGVFVEKMAIW